MTHKIFVYAVGGYYYPGQDYQKRWPSSRCIPHGGHQMSLNIAAGLGQAAPYGHSGSFAADKIRVRDLVVGFKMNPVKTLLVLLAAGGLLLASQRPAQAQVSWGIPLPFPFLFYNFNQGYYSQQPYYGQRGYYGQRYYYRPANCTPSRSAYFYRPYSPPRYYYYGPAWQPGYYAPRYYGPGWGGYGGW